jgi:hypothetical protein
MGNILIATVPKNKREEVRISIDVFNGQHIFNSRVWYEAENGKRKPAKAGLALRLECLEAYAEAVTSALMAAKARGYLR